MQMQLAQHAVAWQLTSGTCIQAAELGAQDEAGKQGNNWLLHHMLPLIHHTASYLADYATGCADVFFSPAADTSPAEYAQVRNMLTASVQCIEHLCESDVLRVNLRRT